MIEHRVWARAAAVVAGAVALTTLTQVSQPAEAMPAGSYVALGDSYSSGEGSPPFDTDGGTCHRSANAYPRVFAARSATYRGAVHHVACSGALIDDLYSANTAAGQPAQFAALSTGVGLVTITIGGNDAGFSAVLAQCVTAYWEAWQPNCQQYYTGNDANNIDRKIDALRASLTQAYRDIRARAANAAVWVLTYPRLFAGSCPLSGAPLRATDAAWLNTEADHLADVTVAAATAAGVTGVLDERHAFAGHEVCTSTPWVNGYTWSGVPWNYTSASFHPTSPGYARMAADLGKTTG